jgi:lipid II:glycine glycyltransferase (peptidoglycan interpeptide bridge formation enzyme)
LSGIKSFDPSSQEGTSDPNDWNKWVAGFPDAHVLQSWEWGQVKARYGWTPSTRFWQDSQGQLAAAALVLERDFSLQGLRFPWKVLYIPKGPLLLDWGNRSLRKQVLDDLGVLGRQRGAIFVKIDPDVRLGSGVPGTGDAIENPVGQEIASELQAAGWRFSPEQVQFRNTVLIDLRADPEALLAGMKQKMRYNIRLAERKGVFVRSGTEADLDLLYRMYAETSVRDGFVIREEAYYRLVWETFMRAGLAEPLIAEVVGEPVAALIVFRFAGKAWYLYGMSRQTHRDKMPNHLLQWEAMLRSRAAGCATYDLWGAPDRFNETDPLWGVYRFKEGFGGQVVRHIGAWDLPIQPFVFRLYHEVMPKMLTWMRRRGWGACNVRARSVRARNAWLKFARVVQPLHRRQNDHPPKNSDCPFANAYRGDA